MTIERLDNPKCLDRYGFKVYSQNDEDGIIEEIFNRIDTTNKTFVEFGVENGLECNSHYLLHKGWHGLWLEGNENAVNEINARFYPAIRENQLKVKNAFITKDNINQLIATSGVVGEIDLLSVDIDGNDYYVWKAIKVVKPRVVVIEYNAKFPPNHAWKMAYNEKHQWDGSDWHGASLKALELLGRELGYRLVGTNLNGVNAFFVRNDLAGNHFIEPATAEALYNPARYQTKYISGHPAKFYLENQLPNIGVINYNPQQYNWMKFYRAGGQLPPEEQEKIKAKIRDLNLPAHNMCYHPTRTKSTFFLPFAETDLSQMSVLHDDNYVEIEWLEKNFFDFKLGVLSKLIGQEGSVVVDIGANMGNHTLYFANELNASKVISFEPVPVTFQILQTNIKINQLEGRVELHRQGVSSKAGRASVGICRQENFGGTVLAPGSGDIDLTTLDALNLPKVTFIKIDVEGMEPQVLEGAIETIKRCRPFVLTESFADKFPIVEEFFAKLNYRYRLGDVDNYLFYPAEYENYHDQDLENYDIIIPVAGSHVHQLHHGLPLIKENLGHDKIVLICKEDTYNHFKDQGVDFIDENSILPGMNIETVRAIITERGGNPSRAGWYLQQFLKMYYAFICQKDYYLIWDADTMPINPIYFLNGRRQMLFNMKSEHHVPYFDTINRLFKTPLKFMEGDKPSFISEGMIIKTDVMRELVTEIGGIDFWKNILNAIDQKEINGSGFSEFETYGNYLVNRYPQLYKPRQLNTLREGAATFGRILNVDELRMLPFDTISFENWNF